MSAKPESHAINGNKEVTIPSDLERQRADTLVAELPKSLGAGVSIIVFKSALKRMVHSDCCSLPWLLVHSAPH